MGNYRIYGLCIHFSQAWNELRCPYYLDFVKGVQEQDFIPTGSLIKSRLDRDIMFEKVIGDKRIVIDSKFRIIEEKI